MEWHGLHVGCWVWWTGVHLCLDTGFVSSVERMYYYYH